MKVEQRQDGAFSIIDDNGLVIVPYGKYDWIDEYQFGFARVKIGKETNGKNNANIKWGIVDELGVEVVPTIYDNIWKFHGTNWGNTILCLKDMEFRFYFHTKEIIRVL